MSPPATAAWAARSGPPAGVSCCQRTSPVSLSVHAAVVPVGPAGDRAGAAAVCARAAVWTTMTSAGTTSVRGANRTAMAIPLWTAVEGRPHIPPSLPGAQGRTTQRPQRASADASGTAWVGVGEPGCGRLGFLGPALGPETPPQRRPADTQPTGRLRESAVRLSERFVDGGALAFGQGPAVGVGHHDHLTQYLRVRVQRHDVPAPGIQRSEEHTSELQSRLHLVCRLLLEKKKNDT